MKIIFLQHCNIRLLFMKLVQYDLLVDTLACIKCLLFLFIIKKLFKIETLKKKEDIGDYNVLTVSKSWIYILFIRICWSFLYLFQLYIHYLLISYLITHTKAGIQIMFGNISPHHHACVCWVNKHQTCTRTD